MEYDEYVATCSLFFSFAIIFLSSRFLVVRTGKLVTKCHTQIKSGMAYRLNLADNGLPIFVQSRLPITDILSVLSFTDTDNRYCRNCRYIGVLPIYWGKITEI